MLRHFLIAGVCTALLGGIHPARCQFRVLTDDDTVFIGERIEDISPFGGVALIPADADTRSFRFEGLKAVRIPTRIRYTADPHYCRDTVAQAAGSMFCPQVHMEASIDAYRVTYSYTGEPLASDDRSGRRFTLEVYFRPSDLPQPLLTLLAADRSPGRALASPYFEVAASRPLVHSFVSDDARSRHCAGYYIDGSWVQFDDDCEETLRTKPAELPSDFITVKVTPVLTDR
jgi:hypothetical protein